MMGTHVASNLVGVYWSGICHPTICRQLTNVCHGASQACIIVSFTETPSRSNGNIGWNEFPKATIFFLHHSFLGCASWKPTHLKFEINGFPHANDLQTVRQNGRVDDSEISYLFSQLKWLVWGLPHFWTCKWNTSSLIRLYTPTVWQVEQHPFDPMNPSPHMFMLII